MKQRTYGTYPLSYYFHGVVVSDFRKGVSFVYSQLLSDDMTLTMIIDFLSLLGVGKLYHGAK